MQGIYAWLTGGFICLLYICIVLDLAVGVRYAKHLSSIDCVLVCKASMLNWLGGPDLKVAVSVCKASVFIVLDLAVGVVVCKASMLNWLGVHLPSIYMHCTRSSSGCSGMQGIYAQLTGGVHLPSIYMHCTRSSSGCSGMQGIYAQLTVYWYSRHLCSIDCRGVDLPVGVLVCKASVLNWLGVHLYMYCTRSSSGCTRHLCSIDWGCPSAFYIYALY